MTSLAASYEYFFTSITSAQTCTKQRVIRCKKKSLIKGLEDEITECVHVPCSRGVIEFQTGFPVSSHVAIIMTIFRRYSVG